jgi:hypothetical protein
LGLSRHSRWDCSMLDRLTPEGRVPEFGSLGGLLGTLE